MPRNPRIHRLYGFSPVEQVVMTVNIALRRTMAQLNYFTEGNIPEALISCPPDWRPGQIREMQEIFDDMLRGNLSERSGAKFVPGGLSVQFTKDALLKDDFDEWLARIICYAFSVPPTAFVKQANRATAENAQDTSLQEGLAPLQNWVKALVDRVLAEDFASPDLEFAWNEARSLSASEAMTVNTGYVAAGLKTRNEVRADIGLDPLPGGDTALVTTATGLVPIMAGEGVTKYDPNEPRDENGRWTDGEVISMPYNVGGSFTTTQSHAYASSPTEHALTPSGVRDQANPANFPPVNFPEFYAKFLPLVRPMTQRVGMNENLVLALIAHEDHWGNYIPNLDKHNFLGITNGGGPNLSFDSDQACVEYWNKHFANSFKGVQDIDTFISRMKTLPKGGYNSASPKYWDQLKDVYTSVLNHRKALKL